jgi:hypothetical protein
LIEFARRFPENGMKLMIEHVRNAQDLLQLLESQIVRWIRFSEMRRLQTTFVQRDYRNVECDVVLLAPLRPPGKSAKGTRILIYVLIEHQSEPEELMPLRLLEYVTQIYRYQERHWRREHRTTAGIRLMPVLPVVFYTGTRRWESPGQLRDLVELGSELGPRIPALQPEFLNLSALTEERLTTQGSFFGRVLHLVQQKGRPFREFGELLRHEVAELEALRKQDRTRWLELLSYVSALVYHDRVPPEQPQLREIIEASVNDAHEREEMRMRQKSMADVHREEGEKRGEKKGELRALRRTLRRQLEQRFGVLPASVEASIRASKSSQQLEGWLARVFPARNLEEVIGPTD